MFTLLLETMDPQDPEFVRYLAAHCITAQVTGGVHGQPGGGEDVLYSASTSEALVSMYVYWFACGDSNTDAELLSGIKELS